MRVHRHKHVYQTVTNLAPHPLHSHPCMMASQTYLCGQHRRNQERPRRLARRKPRHTLAQPAAPGCSMPAYNPRIIRASCNVKAMTEYGYCVYSHVHAHAYAGGRDSCRFAPLRLHRGPASIEAPGEIDVGVQRRFHMQHTPPNMFMNSCNQMSLSCVCERERQTDRQRDGQRQRERDGQRGNEHTSARAHTHTHTHTHKQRTVHMKTEAAAKPSSPSPRTNSWARARTSVPPPAAIMQSKLVLPRTVQARSILHSKRFDLLHTTPHQGFQARPCVDAHAYGISNGYLNGCMAA